MLIIKADLIILNDLTLGNRKPKEIDIYPPYRK